jgi:phosphatidylserine decarboxylase
MFQSSNGDTGAQSSTLAVDRYPVRAYGAGTMRLTRHGTREILVGTVVLALIGLALGWAWAPLAVLVVPVFIWLLSFFRDPERVIPVEQHIMVSPADGTVSDVGDVDRVPGAAVTLNEPCARVGIFLSVFNVHMNRAPCDAKIQTITYSKGKFINALKHNEASEFNENNTIVLADPVTGQPVAVVRQIVGLIARRIIFPHKEGETVQRGQRIGMMKFGSRTELYIPKRLQPTIKVKVGDAVKGGSDIIAILGGHGIHTTVKAPLGDDFEPLVGRETPA